MNLLGSELRKQFSTRLWLGLAAAGLGLTALNALALALLAGVELEGATAMPPLTDPATLAQAYAAAGSASAVALITGIIAMTGEFRHHTITSTFLATPRRIRVLVAKMGAQALVGAVLGLACWAVALGCIAVVLPFREHSALDYAAIGRVGLAVVIAFALYAVLGVAFGSLVRNQLAAIATALLWVMLVEALIVALLPKVGQWLPGGALNGLLAVQSTGGDAYLDPVPAGLLLLAWTIVLAGASSTLVLRRDVS